MIRTQIQLEDEQADALKRIAAARDVSMAAVIREAVDALIRVEDRDRLVARALAACGGSDSGDPDLAERHDEDFAAAVERR